MCQVRLCIFMMLAFAIAFYPVHVSLGTWSIVAVDPVTGDVGVAAATCRSMVYIDYVAALVPGKGAAATQAWTTLKNRDTVFQLLQEGYSAEDIIKHVSNPGNDSHRDVRERQYGVVTLSDGSVRAAAFTGEWNADWAGSQQDIGMGVTVQGNILVSEAVVADAMQAFKEADDQGYNALPDRLMRALEAGSPAGGDRRCNNEQTAASTFILVARGGDPPYAASEGITDMGTPNAPWLAISVTEPMFGSNPIIELRERYDVWRENIVSVEPQAKLATTWGNIKESQFGLAR